MKPLLIAAVALILSSCGLHPVDPFMSWQGEHTNMHYDTNNPSFIFYPTWSMEDDVN